MAHLGPRRHLHHLPPLLLHLHVLAQAGPRMHRRLLPTTRRYHHHLHTTTRRTQSALPCPALAPRPMLLLLRRLLLRRTGTRLRLRVAPLLRPLCSHHYLGEEALMCLLSVVVVVVVAVGQELVLGVCRLIILLKLKAHSRNIRHNNIEHREIVGSSFVPPPVFLPWMVNYLSLRVRGFLSFCCYTRIIGVCYMFVNTRSTPLYRPFFFLFSPGCTLFGLI